MRKRPAQCDPLPLPSRKTPKTLPTKTPRPNAISDFIPRALAKQSACELHVLFSCEIPVAKRIVTDPAKLITQLPRRKLTGQAVHRTRHGANKPAQNAKKGALPRTVWPLDDGNCPLVKRRVDPA